MTAAFMIGRILTGTFYIYHASHNFMTMKSVISRVGSKGIPFSGLTVVISEILLLIAGLSFITGFLPTIGICASLIFLLPVTFIMHNFWTIEDKQLKRMQTVNFTKNIAIMASSLMFLAIPQPWPFSL